MRRRLEIARALLADPKVMFLDEPTLGLDPIARRDLWQVVRTLRERHGVTIVLSTHYLEEAQHVCDRVAIVDEGLIVEEGKPSELVDRLGASIAAVLTVAAGRITLIVVLSVVRGAHFHLAVGPTLAALAAGGLLAGGTYALAEYLAYTLKQPQTFGTLIPAIGATPYLLCGALYPIATLPDGVRQLSWILPWSHAVALLRDGFIGSGSSHLDQIWHMHSQIAMVLLSLGVLAAFAGLMVALAIRAFRRAALA